MSGLIGFAAIGSATSVSTSAASQATWFIDGQNVTGLASDANSGLDATHPLLTDQERARRVGRQVIQITTTVTLLSSLGDSDYITEPAVGINGCFIVTGSPGATVLHTGTLTGATAQTGNSGPTVTDSGVTWASPTNLIGFRIRITSGANVGAVCWTLHSVSAHVALVSDPEVVALDPAQFELTSVTLAVSDPYVVESLPMIPTVISPYGSADGINDNGGDTRYMYEGCNFSTLVFNIPGTSDYFGRQFIGCNMGGITAPALIFASLWNLVGRGGQSEEFESGTEAICLGCGFMFDTGFLVVAEGAALTLDQGSIVYGGPVKVDGWLGIGVYSGGPYIGAPAVGCIGSPTDGVIVRAGGALKLQSLLYGAGNAAYGLRVMSGGVAAYVTKPTITGTTNDTIVGGTAKAYAAIPFFNTANGAGIVVDA